MTQRDQAAASLADVFTLESPRADTDDPLNGITPPASGEFHPDSATPSRIDRIQASRIAALPIRNEKGHYEESAPDFDTAGDLSDFIRDRSAAWSQHVERQRRRRRGRWDRE